MEYLEKIISYFNSPDRKLVDVVLNNAAVYTETNSYIQNLYYRLINTAEKQQLLSDRMRTGDEFPLAKCEHYRLRINEGIDPVDFDSDQVFVKKMLNAVTIYRGDTSLSIKEVLETLSLLLYLRLQGSFDFPQVGDQLNCDEILDSIFANANKFTVSEKETTSGRKRRRDV